MCDWTGRNFLEAWFNPSIACPDDGLKASIRVFDENNVVVFEVPSIELPTSKWTRMMASIHLPCKNLTPNILKEDITTTTTSFKVFIPGYAYSLFNKDRVFWIEEELFKCSSDATWVSGYNWTVYVVGGRGYSRTTARPHVMDTVIYSAGDKSRIKKLLIQFENKLETTLTNIDLFIDQISTLRTEPDPLLLDFPFEESP